MNAETPQVVDSTAEEVGAEPRQELVPAAAVTVSTPVRASDLVERLGTIREAMETAMEKDVDYGVIPGTQKPTLLKPGAEKLGVLFQLDAQTTHEERWGPGDHLTVSARTIIFHAPTGSRLGSGEGMCSTRERKYAYRNAEPVCPDCGKANIRKSKKADGFYCWVKTDGCGANFSADDKRITEQQAGQIDNPDLPDTWNTIIKMARKRALVDAVLLVTGASALFTQDVEDMATEVNPAHVPAQRSRDVPPERSNDRSRVSAQPAKATERAATAKQRGLINGKASEKDLPPSDLANIVLTAAGQEPREFDSQSDAEQWLKRQIDRLPGRLVDTVLAGIEAA